MHPLASDAPAAFAATSAATAAPAVHAADAASKRAMKVKKKNDKRKKIKEKDDELLLFESLSAQDYSLLNDDDLLAYLVSTCSWGG